MLIFAIIFHSISQNRRQPSGQMQQASYLSHVCYIFPFSGVHSLHHHILDHQRYSSPTRLTQAYFKPEGRGCLQNFLYAGCAYWNLFLTSAISIATDKLIFSGSEQDIELLDNCTQILKLYQNNNNTTIINSPLERPIYVT